VVVEVLVRRVGAHSEGLPLPRYMTENAAGLDLLSAAEGPTTLSPGGIAMIPTGLAFALPEGYEAQVRPRSGLAAEHGVTVLNAPGTIDSDYRGEVRVLLINHGARPVVIERGTRIAQLVLGRVERLKWHEVADLPPSQRGSGGFGSTGS
jgi:dUTP pyrophosphatase